MIRRLGQLNVLGIEHVIVGESVLFATDETLETFFLYFIVVVHVGSTGSTSGNLIDGFLYRIHLIRNRR